MDAPDGLGIKIYLTLLKLYAEQENVRITGTLEDGETKVEFDTNDPIPSCQEIVKRYGRTNLEIERASEKPN